MNITVPVDSAVLSCSGIDSKSLTPSGATNSRVSGSAASEDLLSVSSSTVNIRTSLSTLSDSRSSRIASLQAQYASGRYTPDSSRIMGALVSQAASSGKPVEL